MAALRWAQSVVHASRIGLSNASSARKTDCLMPAAGVSRSAYVALKTEARVRTLYTAPSEYARPVTQDGVSKLLIAMGLPRPMDVVGANKIIGRS